jgi:membrane protein YqaA with SNARE-associated domain
MPAPVIAAAIPPQQYGPLNVLRRLYNWTLSLAAHRRAVPALALISFTESSFFPIPPDVVLIPMVLAARARAFFIAAVCTISSVLGGIAGYAIGFFLYETIGKPLLDFYGYTDRFADFQGHYNEWGLLIVFAAGLTPLPYKVFTIASGVTGLGLVPFIAGSLISRGLRFYVIAFLLWRYGSPIRTFVESNLKVVATIFMVTLFAGFMILRYAI